MIKTGFSFLGVLLDRRMNNDGVPNTWRPIISLGTSPEIGLDELHIIWQADFQHIMEEVISDLAELAPHLRVIPYRMELEDPWDFEDVYSRMYDYVLEQKLEPETHEYYIHISTGTHVMQISWFLLNESHLLPGKLLQSHPVNDRTKGNFTVIDLDLSRYDKLAQRFYAKQKNDLEFLKSGIATRSRKFNSLIETIEKVAIRSSEPILLTGPTGAGKSRLAKRIYELKKLNKQLTGNFVDVNCATLRGDQATSTLFGHKRGAFTGAVADRPGLLKMADKGILFLDEIGELGLDEQAMLLRAIEEKVFLPLGADKETSSDFQLICGTNRDLHKEVQAGNFREDLLARINLWAFKLPGLGERREDIEPNLEYELQKFSMKNGQHITFNKEGYELFMQYAMSPRTPWNGNFRELNAIVTRLATLAPGGRIDKATVQTELDRLQENMLPAGDNILNDLLPSNYMDLYDPFDLAQLEYTVNVCRESKNISEAGRQLFSVTRTQRKTRNDTDRLTKYLAKFDLSFEKIKAGN
ncbi:MAG: RNA repair transcriptional activator RtcR [Lentisphaeria bacterium]|nr:RNA repair transcriptional activator RtcR [Lentisphaeria bacterium]